MGYEIILIAHFLLGLCWG